MVPLNTASSPSFDMAVASSCVLEATQNAQQGTEAISYKPGHLSFTPVTPWREHIPMNGDKIDGLDAFPIEKVSATAVGLFL